MILSPSLCSINILYKQSENKEKREKREKMMKRKGGPRQMGEEVIFFQHVFCGGKRKELQVRHRLKLVISVLHSEM